MKFYIEVKYPIMWFWSSGWRVARDGSDSIITFESREHADRTIMLMRKYHPRRYRNWEFRVGQ